VQFGLPADLANTPHPEVEGYRPVFRTRNDPKLKQIVHWIADSLAPLQDDELDEQQQERLRGVLAPGGTQNIFRTLARHPGLFRKWMPFGGKLLNGKLPARERELAILRVGWLCQSEYEWGQHVPIGKRAGLTDDEIARIPQGPGASGWTELDATILRATDELHEDSCISDATWERLAQVYDDKQLIELVMSVGHYHLVSMALNTLGVQREEGVVGLPDA
jgi:alkylhydroperoxidase family enzyme